MINRLNSLKAAGRKAGKPPAVKRPRATGKSLALIEFRLRSDGLWPRGVPRESEGGIAAWVWLH